MINANISELRAGQVRFLFTPGLGWSIGIKSVEMENCYMKPL